MNVARIDSLMAKISFTVHENNQPVTITFIPPELKLIGYGTDAVVVQFPELPDRVFKVFSPDREYKWENERTAYLKIGVSPFYPRFLGSGKRYLILSYEEGPTLLQCLEQGIVIPEQVILDVEEARKHARKAGLNPRDIHLNNIIFQHGRAKLLDLSEFVLPGNDARWDHLVEGYYRFYPLIRGRKIPKEWIEAVKKLYLAQTKSKFSVAEFGKRLFRMLGWNRNSM
jgi:hypothetical protein